MKINQIGEFELIERLARSLDKPGANVIVGIGDDAAVIDIGTSEYLLFTTDMLVENIHFSRKYATGYQIGWRAIAANISDIAAMGGLPGVAAVSLGVAGDVEVEWVEEVYKGMRELAAKYKVDIIGGDTVSSPQIIINIALTGQVSISNLSLRSHAQLGDLILATGDFGGSAAGLELLQNIPSEIRNPKSELNYVIARHLTPEPRIEASQIIASHPLCHALTDSSDGLASDLRNIGLASGVGAKVYADKIPIHGTTKKVAELANKNPIEFALQGGEDYELVFTMPPDAALDVKTEVEQKLNLPISILGEIVPKEQGITLIHPDGSSELLTRFGYNHFIK
ncbi:MAG: thiamine-phosphate kinase [bacterium]|nr:thiamine-phosphate kinase [bacterium]